MKASGGVLGGAVLKHVPLHLSLVLGGLLGAARDAAPVVPLTISVQASGSLASLHLEALVGGPCRDGDQVPADGALGYPLRVPLA